ncbi:MAG: hypothetical protein WC264_02740 [Candidatus Paceibacterota bacterium]|jgi:hypothetical protein
MITKHFFKILIIFIGIIIIGLIGVFLVGYFDDGKEQSKILNGAILIFK